MTRKWPLIVSILYLVAVFVLVFLAFDFTGRIHFNMLLALIALTLPWSMVSVIFMWALMHGAGLGFFAVMYAAFGFLNAFLINKIFGTGKIKE